MARIAIHGSDRVGVVHCVRLLQSAAGLSSAEAQKIMACVLRGDTQHVEMRSGADAAMLAAALSKLGAPSRLVADS